MGFQLNTSVLNQKGSPAIYTDTFANRPPFGYAGRLFISNDTAAIYEDTGTAWVLIANVSSGAGTLQQVTTNGNTSNVGISVTAGGISSNSFTDTSLANGSVLFSTSGLINDSVNLFYDLANTRLGIGTNTPGNTLDVHSAGTNPILALNNTAGNQSAISFLNTSVSQWRIGNKATTNTLDIFNFILNNHAIRINSGDNSIEITNNINVQSNGSIFGSNANGSDPVRIQANNVQKVIRFLNPSAGTADLYVAGTSTSSAFYFSTFSTANALRIENSGAVLVNNPTDDGVNKLQVNGGLTSTRANFTIPVESPASGNTALIAKTSNGGNDIFRWFDGATQLGVFKNSGAVLINSTVDDTVNKLQVTGSTILNGTTQISVTNPGNSVSTGAITLISTATAINDRLNINFCQNGVPARVRAAIGSLSENTNGYDCSLAFYTRAAVDASALSTSDIKMSLNSGGTLNIVNLAGTGSRAVLADATGNLSAPVSDISVKENIEPLKYGLETIMQLNAVQFEFINGYKNYGEGLQIGAIAQEVEQIIPEAVFKTPSTGLKGIDYNQFNGIYIKAIQDQQKIIESLIQRIELLENK